MNLEIIQKRLDSKSLFFFICWVNFFILMPVISGQANASDRRVAYSDDHRDHGHPQVREYWIAAEQVDWDYAPSGQNLINPKKDLGP